MFRVMFLIEDAIERQRSATELRGLTMGGDARVVTAFVDSKTLEVFVDIAESALPREVFDRLAHRLGVDEYEVTRVEPVEAEPVGGAAAVRRRRLRRAAITQVRTHPDGRTLSVQARHRPDETVETVEVQQTDDAVGITVLVGTADDDVREQFVSFAVSFTWVDTILDRPVGNRQIIHLDSGHPATFSEPAREDRRESPPDSFEPIQPFEPRELMELGEELFAPLERLVARLDLHQELDSALTDGGNDDDNGFGFSLGHEQVIESVPPESLGPDIDEVIGIQSDGEPEGTRDSEDERVVALLLPYRDALAGAARAQRPDPFVRKKWRRALDRSGLTSGQVEALFDVLPKTSIGRNDLRQMARAAQGTQADLNLFVATMAWGRGKRNAGMPARIVGAIDDSRRAAVLAETARLATAGDVERAYRAWTLPGLGPPFFTRWLWAASLRGDPGTRPLILDRRVRRSLKEALGWSMRQAAGTDARAARYRAYCEAAARWANALSDAQSNVAPEDIECALLRADGSLRRLEN
jgi:hypothetical protein